MATSPILWNHHILPQAFGRHQVIQLLGGQDAIIKSPRNRIYLPSDAGLANQMGVSPHPGGPLDAYTKGVCKFLEQQLNSAEFRSAFATGDTVARNRLAANMKDFQDVVRVGLINGDVFTNTPVGMTADDANKRTAQFFQNLQRYARDHADQMAKVDQLQSALEQAGKANTGTFALLLPSGKVNMADKLRALDEFIARNPDRKLVSDDQPGDLEAFKRFAEGDPNGSAFTALNPDDVRDFTDKGISVPYLDFLHQLPGFPAIPQGPTTLSTPPLDPAYLELIRKQPGFPAVPQGPTILSTPAFDPRDIPYPGGFPQQAQFPPLPPSTTPQERGATPYRYEGNDAINTADWGLALPAVALALTPLVAAAAPRLSGAAASALLARYLGPAVIASLLASRPVAAAQQIPQDIIDEDFKALGEPQPFKPQDGAPPASDVIAPGSSRRKSDSGSRNGATDSPGQPTPDQSATDAQSMVVGDAPFGLIAYPTFDPVRKRWISLPGSSQSISFEPQSGAQANPDFRFGSAGLLSPMGWLSADGSFDGGDGTAPPGSAPIVPFSLAPPVPEAPVAPFGPFVAPGPLDALSPFGSLAPPIPPARTRSLDPYIFALWPPGGFGSLAPPQPPTNAPAAD